MAEVWIEGVGGVYGRPCEGLCRGLYGGGHGESIWRTCVRPCEGSVSGECAGGVWEALQGPSGCSWATCPQGDPEPGQGLHRGARIPRQLWHLHSEFTLMPPWLLPVW